MSLILIVDDDPTLRVIAGEMLRDDAHEIVEAEDGEAAMKTLAARRFDLVVLDMLMPNKDGLETIIELRNRQPDIRILAISSGGRMSGAGLLNTARAFGAHDTMVKPLHPDAFRSAVARLLGA